MPIQKVIDKPELPQQVVKKITNQEMIEKILKALENKDAEQKTYALKMLQQYGR
ncbi:MAG: hypothetical protein LBI53_06635 [Candidatus Peribacteria bacterium]|jgi:hypothetical protein|nr:hypothetical protein [Candidatus Peribacteria bacterium]